MMLSQSRSQASKLARLSGLFRKQVKVPRIVTLSERHTLAEQSQEIPHIMNRTFSKLARMEKQTSSDFDKQLWTATSIEAILDVSSSKESLTLDDVCHILEQIDYVCCKQDQLPAKKEIDQMFSDERYTRLVEVVQENIKDLKTPDLLKMLQISLKLTSEDLPLVTLLENKALWSLKMMPMSFLIQVIQIHTNQCQTDVRKKVYENALKTIERRWEEIHYTKDLVSLIYATMNMRPELLKRLEEKALQMSGEFSPKDSYRIFHLLGQLQRRNAPLIRMLTYELNKSLTTLTISQMVNVVHACANLSCYNESLLNNIAKELLLTTSEENFANDHSVAGKLLKSYGKLQYRNTPLLDMLYSTVLKHMDKASNHELSFLLMTCATLSYMSSQVEEKLSEILQRLETAKDSAPRIWLDAIWSLVVLNKADSNHLESVLKQSFYNVLKSTKPLDSAYLRLLNVNAATHFDVPSYSGPRLPDNFISVNNITVPLRSGNPLTKSVIQVIASMAPAEKYCNIDVVTPQGHIIDIEIVVNGDGQLQPVNEYQNLYRDTAEDKKPLPDNFHRLAIKALNFRDMTMNEVQPNGLQKMCERHLTSQGYKVLSIPYYEFLKEKNVVKQVAYLTHRIKSVVSSKS